MFFITILFFQTLDRRTHMYYHVNRKITGIEGRFILCGRCREYDMSGGRLGRKIYCMSGGEIHAAGCECRTDAGM